jgi:hypothetical protein
MRMFDEKGECKYCSKPTRAKSTSLCNACYKLDLAIKNNPNAAEKILENYKDIKPQKKMWDEEGIYNPYTGPRSSQYYVPDNYKKPYRECRPKENQ